MSKKEVTRVKATQDKLELLLEMRGMIDTLKKFSARIEDKIQVMLDADLESMKAEKEAIETMSDIIKNGKQ